MLLLLKLLLVLSVAVPATVTIEVLPPDIFIIVITIRSTIPSAIAIPIVIIYLAIVTAIPTIVLITAMAIHIAIVTMPLPLLSVLLPELPPPLILTLLLLQL